MSQFSELITVVLVEDHGALRKGIELLLSRRGCVIVGAADDAGQGYEFISANRPDVAVVDLGLPGGSGAELTCRLLEEDPGQGVLLYTGSEDLETISGGLDCGARGFVHKTGSPEELIAGIRAVADGGTYMDARLGSALLSRSSTEQVHELSPRQREIFDLLAQGLTGAQIAKRLFISSETVRTHIRNAMAKLEARTRVHAITLALQLKEIDFANDAFPPGSSLAPHTPDRG